MEKELTLNKTTKDKIIDYITYFFIYAFLGWCIETIYAIFIHGFFVKRGFLYGPICPIYGFGAIILIMTTINMYGKPIKKFLIATIAFTAFEYFVSLILETLFGLRWWDYSNDFLKSVPVVYNRLCYHVPEKYVVALFLIFSIICYNSTQKSQRVCCKNFCVEFKTVPLKIYKLYYKIKDRMKAKDSI